MIRLHDQIYEITHDSTRSVSHAHHRSTWHSPTCCCGLRADVVRGFYSRFYSRLAWPAAGCRRLAHHRTPTCRASSADWLRLAGSAVYNLLGQCRVSAASVQYAFDMLLRMPRRVLFIVFTVLTCLAARPLFSAGMGWGTGAMGVGRRCTSFVAYETIFYRLLPPERFARVPDPSMPHGLRVPFSGGLPDRSDTRTPMSMSVCAFFLHCFDPSTMFKIESDAHKTAVTGGSAATANDDGEWESWPEAKSDGAGEGKKGDDGADESTPLVEGADGATGAMRDAALRQRN